ncbi:MAG TPA: SAM-dependent methyltransferase [Xanthobacteraceae bacterium]|nr:SAM-dependent methyltransferase [Xanthobacteraceae bacterium]
MSGHLAVIGLGPGDARQLTPEADAALKDADVVYGYARYLERIPARSNRNYHIPISNTAAATVVYDNKTAPRRMAA